MAEPDQKRFHRNLFLPSSNGLELSKSDSEKDQYYFATYDKISIHEDMIRDQHRTMSYRFAMLQNRHLFRDKVVVDVGCGTGILSMFAVQAGARKVYALEQAEIAEQAELVIAANGMSDKIHVMRGNAENVQLPEMADVLISEWMGYFLLYEGMLDTVIAVRDRWLRPEGYMFPEWASLHVSLLSNPEFYDARINFWRHRDALLGDLDLSALLPFAKRCNFQEPVVESMDPEQIASNSHCLVRLSLKTCTLADISQIQSSFTLSSIIRGTLSGLAGWFDVGFPGTNSVVLTTSPESGHRTHWRQSMFFLNEPLEVDQDTSVQVNFVMQKCPRNKRFLEFRIHLSVSGGGPAVVQDYLMA